uniref:Uncharacterized protein n=1 Tax=Mus spicilegus TaxID=10103 RepID=A0A8C6GBX2_MUSSI
SPTLEEEGMAKKAAKRIPDTSFGGWLLSLLKSWLVQKVMANSSSLILKNISTLIPSQVE